MKKFPKTTVHHQPSWALRSNEVEAFVTELGGHLGPVTFCRRDRKIQPFSVAPWAGERLPAETPAILRVLRGDFFCLPFGGNGTALRGERHPVHGETANARWRFESFKEGERTCLHCSIETGVRPGRVDKRIFLVESHNAIYSQHVISGMRGPMNPGHHAMVRFPDHEGSGVLSFSRYVYGQVFPEAFEQPAQGGYNWLKAGAKFESLEQVPDITGGTVDLTRYPARRGFEDLVMVVSDPKLPFAWTAVAFPKERYAYFAIKNPRVLGNTVLWISNGGRHYAPWSGRHINVMGIEDVTANFHYGLAESAKPNPISSAGYPTCLTLSPKQPLVVPYIMGVAPIPSGFDRVADIEPGDGEVVLRACNGKKAKTPLDLSFLEQSTAWA